MSDTFFPAMPFQIRFPRVLMSVLKALGKIGEKKNHSKKILDFKWFVMYFVFLKLKIIINFESYLVVIV